MPKSLKVTDAEPDVLEVLDDSDLDEVSGGQVFFILGQLTFIGNNQGFRPVSIGFINVD